MKSSTVPGVDDPLRGISRLWWLWIVFGIAWIVIAAVILQFDQASITTVGVLIGLMFIGAAAQQFVVGSLADRRRPRVPVPDRGRVLDHPGLRRP